MQRDFAEGRISMSYYLLMCRSLTYAQRLARELEKYGIGSSVTRGPQNAGTGCSYGVKISERRLGDALRAAKNAGMDPLRVYLNDSSGLFREVSV